MHDHRIGADRGPRPFGAGAGAQVGLLAIHEKGRIKAAQLVPERLGDQEERAQSLLDYPLRNQTLLCLVGLLVAVLVSKRKREQSS